ncbi:MAG: adenylosuccinate lyase, partial [Clostridia bacterium]
KPNDLLERIAADPAFSLDLDELRRTLEPARYIGRAPEQTQLFIDEYVSPVLERCQAELGVTAELNV